MNIKALEEQVKIAELQARLAEARYKKIVIDLKINEFKDDKKE